MCYVYETLIYYFQRKFDNFLCKKWISLPLLPNLQIIPGIANLENSEGGGISVEGVFWFFGWGGYFLENKAPLKKARKIGSSVFSLFKPKFN